MACSKKNALLSIHRWVGVGWYTVYIRVYLELWINWIVRRILLVFIAEEQRNTFYDIDNIKFGRDDRVLPS